MNFKYFHIEYFCTSPQYRSIILYQFECTYSPKSPSYRVRLLPSLPYKKATLAVVFVYVSLDTDFDWSIFNLSDLLSLIIILDTDVLPLLIIFH